jgi:hypothetical protein
MKQFSNEQALDVVKECQGDLWALAQALDFAAAVARANARHNYGTWTNRELEEVYCLGLNPDLINALDGLPADFWITSIYKQESTK